MLKLLFDVWANVEITLECEELHQVTAQDEANFNKNPHSLLL